MTVKFARMFQAGKAAYSTGILGEKLSHQDIRSRLIFIWFRIQLTNKKRLHLLPFVGNRAR
jgi:hypothetical protein